MPHHVTQRGNRRQPVFFRESDYSDYRALLSEWCRKRGVAIWAYCLMPNHVHLIAVPRDEDSLRRGIGEAHRRYTRQINFQKGWRGHLWQGRFASCPMDERHLVATARYIELNPVRAKLVARPEEYRWSSARAHLKRTEDALVDVRPLLDIVGNWKELLASGMDESELQAIRKHEQTGRPLGSEAFTKKLEKKLNRILHRLKPGPKVKTRKK
jgi:putative transposase